MKNKMILKRSSFFILLFFAFSLFFDPSNAFAAETHIYDDGEFLNAAEIERLETKLHELEQKAGVDLIVLTTKYLGNKSETKYIEDYSDRLYFDGLISEDAAIMLYGQDYNGRFVEIHGYGTAEEYLTEKRIYSLIDYELIPLFKSNDIEKAVICFAENSAIYMNKSPASDSIFANIWFHLIISVAIGAIVVGVLLHNSSGKVTTKNSTYLDQSHSGVTARRDRYIRTSVSKVRRPQASSSSGSSGGSRSGTSSGGRSHSGGGRRF